MSNFLILHDMNDIYQISNEHNQYKVRSMVILTKFPIMDCEVKLHWAVGIYGAIHFR